MNKRLWFFSLVTVATVLAACAGHGSSLAPQAVAMQSQAAGGHIEDGALTATPAFEKVPFPAMDPGFDGVPYLAASSDGKIWFTDPGSYQVGYMDPVSRTAVVYPSAPPVTSPPYVSQTPAPLAVNAEPGGGAIFLWNFGYGTASTAQPPQYYVTAAIPYNNGTVVDYPWEPADSFAVASDGSPWFGSLTEPSSTSSVVKSLQHGGLASVRLPKGLSAYAETTAPDGSIWVATDSPKLLRYSSAGTLIATYTMLNGGWSEQLAVGPDGNIWVSTYIPSPASQVEDVNVSSGAQKNVAPLLGAFLPSLGYTADNMVIGPDNAMWFSEGGLFLERLDTAGGYSTYQFTTSDNNGGVSHVARGSDGNMWFTGGYDGFGVFHMKTIKSTPENVSVTRGSHTSITISEIGYGGIFTQYNPGNCWVTSTNGKTFTIAPPSGITAQSCVTWFTDAKNMGTVFVAITAR